MTLGQAFKEENNIGFMRLMAAMLVVFGHSFSYGGFEAFPNIGRFTNNQISESRLAVDVFFILSGFLITKSYLQQKSFLRFVWARFLRIYPAYWTCLALMAVTLALFEQAVGFGLILKNVALVNGVYTKVTGILSGNPIPGNFNGALWTLSWEVRAYFMLALLGFFGLLHNRPLMLGVALFFWGEFVFLIMDSPGVDNGAALYSGKRLMSFFSMGMVFYLYKDSMRLSRLILVMCLLIMIVSVFVGVSFLPHAGGVFYMTAPPVLTYVTLYVAVGSRFSRINSSYDLSYGIYLYGTFVITLLVFRWPEIVWVPLMLVTTGVTAILAIVSYYLVERPALRLKGRLPVFLTRTLGVFDREACCPSRR